MSTEDLRKLGTAACLLAVLLPFCTVTIPPITDLPQQMAQIRLLGEAVGDPEYRIGWWHPNKLGYVPLAAAWMVTAPFDAHLHAARLGTALIALAWFAAFFAAAHHAQRSTAAAAVALLFVWNNALYWGFLNFLVGVPVFLWWISLIRNPEGKPPNPLLPAFVALLLYGAHILWLAVALLWMALETLLIRRDPRLFTRRLLGAAPALALTLLWAPTFLNAGVDERTFYGPLPWERLQPGWLVTSALGGVRGMLEPALLIAVVLWLGIGLWQHRGRGIDKPLLRAALLLLALTFFLPSVHRHTILFASRWLPAACALLVLALPAPKRPSVLPGAVAGLLWLIVGVSTSSVWVGFERDELSGLRPALEALPGPSRVLGLDFVRESPRIRAFPYYHLPVYAQVLHGGEPARSFADEASSLVSWSKLPREDPWTPRLDWKPEGLRHSDLDHFDHLIVHGDETIHRRFDADPKLRRVETTTGPWRLYVIRQNP